jgi:hypothetical protein
VTNYRGKIAFEKMRLSLPEVLVGGSIILFSSKNLWTFEMRAQK